MNILDIRGFDHARTAALSSSGVSRGMFRLGAVLLDNARIVASGYNQYKTHPLLAETSPYPCLHAETHALFKAGLDNVEGMELYVLRLGKLNDIRMAKPCEVCQHWISEAKLSQVFYSISETDYGILLK